MFPARSGKAAEFLSISVKLWTPFVASKCFRSQNRCVRKTWWTNILRSRSKQWGIDGEGIDGKVGTAKPEKKNAGWTQNPDISAFCVLFVSTSEKIIYLGLPWKNSFVYSFFNSIIRHNVKKWFVFEVLSDIRCFKWDKRARNMSISQPFLVLFNYLVVHRC